MMARKDRLLLSAERGRFLLTTDTDEAWEGVLVDWDENHYVLADAYAVTAEKRTPADGSIWLPRPRIKYLQKLL